MGFISNLVGGTSGNSGGAGSNFNATLAPVIDPVTGQQIQQANQGAQSTAQQQAAFANAVAGQNGLGNQAATFGQQANLTNQLAGQNAVANQSQALGAQRALQGQIAGQNGVGNQSQVFNQQQALANQYQNVANGTGPNPALAQLNQTTGNNIAAQNALMAGQRGAGANIGLLARQAGQQGAATQQQAVGQGATLAAQQQLAGMQGLAQQQQALGNTAQQQIANQAGANQAVANTAQQQIANQQGAIAQQANQAGTQVGQQQAALNAATQGAQGLQGNVLGAVSQVNNANVSAQNSVNAANAGVANTVAGQQGALLGGAFNAAGSGLGLNKGGVISVSPNNYADGGSVATSDSMDKILPQDQPQLSVQPTRKYGSNAFNQLIGEQGGGPFQLGAPSEGQNPLGQGISNLATGIKNQLASPQMAKGGQVPAMLSPGERYLPPKDVKKVAEGKADPMKAGKNIPGKAKVKGAKDDYANDTVPAKLEEGGLVLPRSVTQAKHPHWEAHKFVSALMAKGKLKA